MDDHTIQEAQEYLTINHANFSWKIADIRFLIKNNSVDGALIELYKIYKDYKRRLVFLVNHDKTSAYVDQTVSGVFRIHMAIKTIERQKEVMEDADIEQGAARGF